MVERSEVLILFSALNDLSAVQDVTGMVHRIFSRIWILGNIQEAYCIAVVAVAGGHFWPDSCICCIHFILHEGRSL